MEPVVFVDVDGVLSRFTDGACVAHNQPVRQPDVWAFHREWNVTDIDFYAPMGSAFWPALAPWEDGFSLAALIEQLVGRDRMAFLTAPVRTAGCEEGKRAWFARHFPQFDPWADLFIGGAKHKAAAPSKLLIDDSDSNCDKFIAVGGAAILIPRPWNRRRSECDPTGAFDVPHLFGEVEQAVRVAILRTHPRAATQGLLFPNVNLPLEATDADFGPMDTKGESYP